MRENVHLFDCLTLLLQSLEGASLVDVQTTALFGNLRVLQEQMQKAVGQDATSIEDLMQKVQVHKTVWPVHCSLVTLATAADADVAFGTAASISVMNEGKCVSNRNCTWCECEGTVLLMLLMPAVAFCVNSTYSHDCWCLHCMSQKPATTATSVMHLREIV